MSNNKSKQDSKATIILHKANSLSDPQLEQGADGGLVLFCLEEFL